MVSHGLKALLTEDHAHPYTKRKGKSQDQKLLKNKY